MAHWGFVVYNLQMHISLTIEAKNIKKDILGMKNTMSTIRKSSLIVMLVCNTSIYALLSIISASDLHNIQEYY